VRRIQKKVKLLFNHLPPNSPPLNGTNHLEAYVGYLKQYQKLNSDGINRELRALERASVQRLASGAETSDVLPRKLIGIDQQLRQQKKFWSEKFSPADWEAYRAAQKAERSTGEEINDLKWIAEEITQVEASLNLSLPAREVTPRRSLVNGEYVKSVFLQEAYYKLAFKRDKVMVRNMLKHVNAMGYGPWAMSNNSGESVLGKSLRDSVVDVQPTAQSSQPRAAVLIAGGFHTPGITKALREQGIAYTVIRPRLTRTEDHRPAVVERQMTSSATQPDTLRMLTQMPMEGQDSHRLSAIFDMALSQSQVLSGKNFQPELADAIRQLGTRYPALREQAASLSERMENDLTRLPINLSYQEGGQKYTFSLSRYPQGPHRAIVLREYRQTPSGPKWVANYKDQDIAHRLRNERFSIPNPSFWADFINERIFSQYFYIQAHAEDDFLSFSDNPLITDPFHRQLDDLLTGKHSQRTLLSWRRLTMVAGIVIALLLLPNWLMALGIMEQTSNSLNAMLLMIGPIERWGIWWEMVKQKFDFLLNSSHFDSEDRMLRIERMKDKLRPIEEKGGLEPLYVIMRDRSVLRLMLATIFYDGHSIYSSEEILYETSEHFDGFDKLWMSVSRDEPDKVKRFDLLAAFLANTNRMEVLLGQVDEDGFYQEAATRIRNSLVLLFYRPLFGKQRHKGITAIDSGPPNSNITESASVMLETVQNTVRLIQKGHWQEAVKIELERYDERLALIHPPLTEKQKMTLGKRAYPLPIEIETMRHWVDGTAAAQLRRWFAVYDQQKTWAEDTVENAVSLPVTFTEKIAREDALSAQPTTSIATQYLLLFEIIQETFDPHHPVGEALEKLLEHRRSGAEKHPVYQNGELTLNNVYRVFLMDKAAAPNTTLHPANVFSESFAQLVTPLMRTLLLTRYGMIYLTDPILKRQFLANTLFYCYAIRTLDPIIAVKISPRQKSSMSDSVFLRFDLDGTVELASGIDLTHKTIPVGLFDPTASEKVNPVSRLKQVLQYTEGTAVNLPEPAWNSESAFSRQDILNVKSQTRRRSPYVSPQAEEAPQMLSSIAGESPDHFLDKAKQLSKVIQQLFDPASRKRQAIAELLDPAGYPLHDEKGNLKAYIHAYQLKDENEEPRGFIQGLDLPEIFKLSFYLEWKEQANIPYHTFANTWELLATQEKEIFENQLTPVMEMLARKRFRMRKTSGDKKIKFSPGTIIYTEWPINTSNGLLLRPSIAISLGEIKGTTVFLTQNLFPLLTDASIIMDEDHIKLQLLRLEELEHVSPIAGIFDPQLVDSEQKRNGTAMPVKLDRHRHPQKSIKDILPMVMARRVTARLKRFLARFASLFIVLLSFAALASPFERSDATWAQAVTKITWRHSEALVRTTRPPLADSITSVRSIDLTPSLSSSIEKQLENHFSPATDIAFHIRPGQREIQVTMGDDGIQQVNVPVPLAIRATSDQTRWESQWAQAKISNIIAEKQPVNNVGDKHLETIAHPLFWLALTRHGPIDLLSSWTQLGTPMFVDPSPTPKTQLALIQHELLTNTDELYRFALRGIRTDSEPSSIVAVDLRRVNPEERAEHLNKIRAAHPPHRKFIVIAPQTAESRVLEGADNWRHAVSAPEAMRYITQQFGSATSVLVVAVGYSETTHRDWSPYLSQDNINILMIQFLTPTEVTLTIKGSKAAIMRDYLKHLGLYDEIHAFWNTNDGSLTFVGRTEISRDLDRDTQDTSELKRNQ